MKLSIKNFKSIKILEEFEIMPLTILSGVNSAGKSSFIQLLLLFKETIEANTSDHQLYLSGDSFSISDYTDILHGRSIENKLKVCFIFDRNEFLRLEKAKNVGVFNIIGDYECRIRIEFDINNNKPFISVFDVRFLFKNDENEEKYLEVKYDGNEDVSINANTGVFGVDIYEDRTTPFARVSYTSIYPTFYERKYTSDDMVDTKASEGPEGSKEAIYLDDFKDVIDTFFRNISYIGPIRVLPQDVYSISKIPNNVGRKGQFVARILEERAKDPIAFKGIEKLETGIKYVDKDLTLSAAVKYWMCDVFDVAADIYAEKKEDNYRIILVRKSGLETSIKHVGFGISQLLPIVVEGLTMPVNGTLILEQPEIHLHPKIQSWLYDFLYGLTLQGKTVIVETHSSHFITRIRRRIAEDQTNKMHKQINLTFIEGDIFKTIELDDFGTLDYYPPDFIEPSNQELSAIIEAQMNKRTTKE